MSNPLDGPITGKQMAQLLRDLREDSARDLDARFSAQDERIEGRLAEQDKRIEGRLAVQTSELDAIIVAAVKGSEDNVKRHLDRRIDDLAEKLEGGVENPYRAPTRNDLG